MADRYEIPIDLQARAIQQLAVGFTARQIYLNLWPTRPPVSLQTFTNALVTLQAAVEGQVTALMRENGCPTPGEVDAAEGDAARLAELTLAPAVQELPLSPGDNEAIAHLDASRQALLKAMYDTLNTPLPGQRRDEKGGIVGEVKYAIDRHGNEIGDPRASRAQTLTTLGNAITANVSVRLRASHQRLMRTIAHHNLRLVRKEEAQAMLDEAEREDRSAHIGSQHTPAFAIDLTGNK